MPRMLEFPVDKRLWTRQVIGEKRGYLGLWSQKARFYDGRAKARQLEQKLSGHIFLSKSDIGIYEYSWFLCVDFGFYNFNGSVY